MKRYVFWFTAVLSVVSIFGSISAESELSAVQLPVPCNDADIPRYRAAYAGDTWRMDFSRFNTYKAAKDDSGGWAWSPHGVWDSHVPECFTYVEFTQ